MKRRAAVVVSMLVLSACELHRLLPYEPSRPAFRAGAGGPEQDETGPFPKTGLFRLSAFRQTGSAGLADDPAIWVHPTDPSLSVVIGTNKNSSGGLHVFDLSGAQLQFVAGGRHNNVDVRYGFMLRGSPVDLVSACDRNNNQIDIYSIDPASRRLTQVGSVQARIRVYGYAMYHSRATGKFYGIVASNDGVEQWEFVDLGNGSVGGVRARVFPSGSLIEGIVADDELGFLYLAEEDRGIYKYYAEPDRPVTRLATVDVVGSASQLVADVEGLCIYYRREGRGYLLASSQGNDRFVVYRREGDNAYLGTFEVPQARDTDGIDASNMALGPLFPLGMFVAQNNDSNFQMVRWQDIAGAMGLAIDTSGYDVRGGDGCADIASVDVPASATVAVGGTVRLSATPRDAGGNPLVGCVLAWSTSDATIAAVDALGLVSGVAAGSATITASSDGASGSVALTVMAAANGAPAVTVNPLPEATLGTSTNLSASFTDEAGDTHTATIAWGDGAVEAGTVHQANRTVTGSHLYSNTGSYTVTVTVTDNHGAAGQGTATATVTERPTAVLYFSLSSSATPGGVTVANEDIVVFDGTDFRLYFDGSDVGLGSLTLDAFAVTSPMQILMSFTSAGTVGGLSMDDSDILLFTATSLGTSTAGTFSMYFDGSDVGLATSDEDVDAIELLPDGRLLLSTLGSFSVPGASGADEDLVAFTPTSLGATTSGTFALYFDGSDVGLTSSSEDVDAVAVDGSGKVYLSTTGAFSVTGSSGQDEDVFVFTPSSLGATTSGTFAAALFFDGSLYGLDSLDLQAMDLP